MDLFVEYAGQGFVVELKLVRATKGRERTQLEALSHYRAMVGGPSVATYIALFDRTPRAVSFPGRNASLGKTSRLREVE